MLYNSNADSGIYSRCARCDSAESYCVLCIGCMYQDTYHLFGACLCVGRDVHNDIHVFPTCSIDLLITSRDPTTLLKHA